MKKIKQNQSGFGHVELLVIIVLVGAIGFTAWRVMSSNSDTEPQASINSQENVESVDLLPTDLSAIKPIGEIQSLAVAQAGSASVLGIELETEDGKTVYVVHLSDGSVLVFDAVTGDSVQLTDDNDDEIEDGQAIPADFVAGISIQQAIDIAKQKRPNSTLEKVELEVEEGIVVYSVRFTDDSRVDVNAADGTIQRLKDEAGTDVIKVDDDFDDDGIDNPEDDDDDNDGISDSDDSDDDNDGIDDDEDDDDDNDGMDDDEDDDDDEDEDDDHKDNSGSGSSNSGSGSN